MATVTADRAASNVNARQQEKGVFCEVSTYELSSTANGTIIQMLKVAAGTTVLDGFIHFDALGGSTTVDVGDGDDDDRYISAKDTSSAGRQYFGENVAGFPRTYSSEDTIDCIIEGADGTGTLTLVVYMTRETVDLA